MTPQLWIAVLSVALAATLIVLIREIRASKTHQKSLEYYKMLHESTANALIARIRREYSSRQSYALYMEMADGPEQWKVYLARKEEREQRLWELFAALSNRIGSQKARLELSDIDFFFASSESDMPEVYRSIKL